MKPPKRPARPIRSIKIKLKVKLFIDGNWYDGDEIITHLERAKYNLIRKIYEKQLESAIQQHRGKSDAVEWTAELLGIDRATVYRALQATKPSTE